MGGLGAASVQDLPPASALGSATRARWRSRIGRRRHPAVVSSPRACPVVAVASPCRRLLSLNTPCSHSFHLILAFPSVLNLSPNHTLAASSLPPLCLPSPPLVRARARAWEDGIEHGVDSGETTAIPEAPTGRGCRCPVCRLLPPPVPRHPPHYFLVVVTVGRRDLEVFGVIEFSAAQGALANFASPRAATGRRWGRRRTAGRCHCDAKRRRGWRRRNLEEPISHFPSGPRAATGGQVGRKRSDVSERKCTELTALVARGLVSPPCHSDAPPRPTTCRTATRASSRQASASQRQSTWRSSRLQELLGRRGP